jgi:hypothetical protein
MANLQLDRIVRDLHTIAGGDWSGSRNAGSLMRGEAPPAIGMLGH